MQQQKQTSIDINKLLIQNECLIRKLIQQSNSRNNKNLVNYPMASMINELERNIITICRDQPPQVMADHKVMKTQSQAFEKMMKKRTGAPTVRPHQPPHNK